MGIWIRSQDKQHMPVIIYPFITHGIDIYGYIACGVVVFLGRYATEAKAMQVMDEIQKYIKEPYVVEDRQYSLDQPDRIGHIHDGAKVYQMPPDDEERINK